MPFLNVNGLNVRWDDNDVNGRGDDNDVRVFAGGCIA